MATYALRYKKHELNPNLPKKWKEGILQPNLKEINRLCTLKTASFSMDNKEDELIKSKIRAWLTNITDCVEAIEETVNK